jgi:hypothetical protein
MEETDINPYSSIAPEMRRCCLVVGGSGPDEGATQMMGSQIQDFGLGVHSSPPPPYERIISVMSAKRRR